MGVYCVLYSVRCLRFIVSCSLCCACCVLFIVYSLVYVSVLVFVYCRSWCGIRCRLVVVCCSLWIVGCALRVARCSVCVAIGVDRCASFCCAVCPLDFVCECGLSVGVLIVVCCVLLVSFACCIVLVVVESCVLFVVCRLRFGVCCVVFLFLSVVLVYAIG